MSSRIIYSRALASPLRSIIRPNVTISRVPTFLRTHLTLPIHPQNRYLFRKFPMRNWPEYRFHTPFSSQSASSADPSRPDLFYHLVDPPTPASSSVPAFALSFISSPPPTSDSGTIIGWLPAQTGDQSKGQGAGLNDFRENPKFRTVLHKAIQDGLTEEVDDILINGALQLQEGWMHIHDARNIPALGRIGDPDDILASVLVRDSKIIPETYQPMPSYRFCTADGVIQLTPGLMQKLQTRLAEISDLEKAP